MYLSLDELEPPEQTEPPANNSNVESMNIPELNPIVVDHSRPGRTLKQSGRFKDYVLGKPTCNIAGKIKTLK